MKSYPVVIEGTWEDIQKRSALFAGSRVRVSLVPDAAKHKPRTKGAAVDTQTARFLRDFSGAWAGDDLDQCLDAVYLLRAEAEW